MPFAVAQEDAAERVLVATLDVPHERGRRSGSERRVVRDAVDEIEIGEDGDAREQLVVGLGALVDARGDVASLGRAW